MAQVNGVLTTMLAVFVTGWAPVTVTSRGYAPVAASAGAVTVIVAVPDTGRRRETSTPGCRTVTRQPAGTVADTRGTIVPGACPTMSTAKTVAAAWPAGSAELAGLIVASRCRRSSGGAWSTDGGWAAGEV